MPVSISARVVELVDTPALGAGAFGGIRVQVPSLVIGGAVEGCLHNRRNRLCAGGLSGRRFSAFLPFDFEVDND